MLRRFMCALHSVYPLTSCPKINILNLRMSSEVAVDLEKRKLEESNLEEPCVKKLKLPMQESADAVLNKVFERRKSKKCVLLLCYLGKEYFGMQRNSDVLTVEEELFKALLAANIILKEEFDFPKTMKFQRAARTDKGVSAVRQIVSLKLPLSDISNELPQRINKLLPPQIRVVAVKRVTQSFDAKIACDARTYSYTLPTFAFASNMEGNAEGYRIPGEKIEEVNEFLKNYVGTHNFYNFTSGRLPGDPSCKRYIMSCECGPPFVSLGLEFSAIKIKGQSFMLHQIRKMVGLCIATMRNLADKSVLDKSWLNERIDIPKAPGLGLMLEELHYDWYNSKYGSDGIHEALKWDEYCEEIEAFKRDNIFVNVSQTEREEKSMLQWLETLPHHSYDVRDAGPPTQLPAKQSLSSSNVTTDKEGEICNSANTNSSTSENGTSEAIVTEVCENTNVKESKCES